MKKLLILLCLTGVRLSSGLMASSGGSLHLMTNNIIHGDIIATIIFIGLVVAVLIGFVSLFFQRDSELKTGEQLLTEKSPTCAAHAGCKKESAGIVNLSHGFGRAPEWVLACEDAIEAARAGLRQFKTKQQIVAEAEEAQSPRRRKNVANRIMFLRDITNLRWLDVKQKEKSVGGRLRELKREQKLSKKSHGRSMGGRHAGGWNTPSDRLLNFKRKLNREDAEFMSPFRAKMRDGIPYKFSTVFDPPRQRVKVGSKEAVIKTIGAHA